uniref:Metallophosphoesterase 1 homolog n=1 Tax=Culex pipiens TaxID=7175 RepID=A0A8D8FFM3_CULPI
MPKLNRFNPQNPKPLPDRCLKVLLVADPQILGNTFDTKLYWPLANYDSDRHLSRTYRRALQHTTPDVICFLGDLMDEGSVATDVQYDEYFARFADIFTQPTADTLMETTTSAATAWSPSRRKTCSASGSTLPSNPRGSCWGGPNSTTSTGSA